MKLDILLDKEQRNLVGQLAMELRKLIASGQLESGDKLPTRVALATQLDIGEETVKRAYQQLIKEGFLISRCSQGTSVAQDARKLCPMPIRLSMIRDVIDELASNMEELDIPIEEVVRVLKQRGQR